MPLLNSKLFTVIEKKRSWSWIPVRLEYGPGSGKMMRNRQIWNQNHNQFLHSTQSVTTLSPFSSKCRASWRSCLALASWAAAGSWAGRGGGASWAAASRAPRALPWLSYCSHSLQTTDNRKSLKLRPFSSFDHFWIMKSVLRIRDILVRIRIPGSVPLTNGSDSFLHWLWVDAKNNIFFL